MSEFDFEVNEILEKSPIDDPVIDWKVPLPEIEPIVPEDDWSTEEVLNPDAK